MLNKFNESNKNEIYSIFYSILFLSFQITIYGLIYFLILSYSKNEEQLLNNCYEEIMKMNQTNISKCLKNIDNSLIKNIKIIIHLNYLH